MKKGKISSADSVLKAVEKSQILAKLFSVDVTIKLFGHEIVSYHFPPKN